MNATETRRAPRLRPGPRPRLDRRTIVAAGLGHDLSTLAVTDVARDLGVTHAAIYRYVDSSQGLLLACLAEIFENLQWHPVAGSWEEALRTFTRRLWELCDEHPGLAQVMFNVPAAPPVGARQFAAVVGELTQAGLRPDLAVLAADFVGDTVFSTHLGIAVRRGPDGTIDPAQTFGMGPDVTAELIRQSPTAARDGLLALKVELIIEAVARRNGQGAPPPAAGSAPILEQTP